MINAYLVDSITIIKSGGYDEWGEPLATTEINVKGKIEYRTKLIKSLAGEDVVSNALVYLEDRELSHEDKIKFDDKEHIILRIDKPKAFSGPHLEVHLTYEYKPIK